MPFYPLHTFCELPKMQPYRMPIIISPREVYIDHIHVEHRNQLHDINISQVEILLYCKTLPCSVLDAVIYLWNILRNRGEMAYHADSYNQYLQRCSHDAFQVVSGGRSSLQCDVRRY